MYEIWNEPVQESWEVIKGYHEAVIPAIRAVDPESIIVVGSRHWDQELEEASLNPIKGVKNVAYAIHFYSGTHRQALRDNGARAMKNGVALFASEYGLSTASGKGGLDFAEQKLWWTGSTKTTSAAPTGVWRPWTKLPPLSNPAPAPPAPGPTRC
jgi:endoglucanase